MKKAIAITLSLVITFFCCILTANAESSIGTAAFTQDISIEISRNGSAWNPGDSLDGITISIDPIEAKAIEYWYDNGTCNFLIKMDGSREFFYIEGKTSATVNGQQAQLQEVDSNLYKVTIDSNPTQNFLRHLINLFRYFINWIKNIF